MLIRKDSYMRNHYADYCSHYGGRNCPFALFTPRFIRWFIIRLHINETTIASFPQITAGSYSALIQNARSSYGSDCLATSKLSPNNAISLVYLNNPQLPTLPA